MLRNHWVVFVVVVPSLIQDVGTFCHRPYTEFFPHLMRCWLMQTECLTLDDWLYQNFKLSMRVWHRFPCNTCSCTGGDGNHWPRSTKHNVTQIINDVSIIYQSILFLSFNHWSSGYSVILSVDRRIIQLFDHSIIWSFDDSIISPFDSISASFKHLIILIIRSLDADYSRLWVTRAEWL